MLPKSPVNSWTVLHISSWCTFIVTIQDEHFRVSVASSVQLLPLCASLVRAEAEISAFRSRAGTSCPAGLIPPPFRGTEQVPRGCSCYRKATPPSGALARSVAILSSESGTGRQA